jgi:hypothetical protein
MLQRVVTCRDLAAMHVITEVTDDERVGGEAALVEPHRETKGELSPGEVQKRHVPCREPHRRGLPGRMCRAPVHADSWVSMSVRIVGSRGSP